MSHISTSMFRRSLSLIVSLIFAVGSWSQLRAQSVRHIIRDPNGAAACVITLPSAGAPEGDDGRLVIYVRVPSTPPADVLGRLPVEKRDYSVLPIRVFLVPRPGNGLSPVALSRVKPLSGDFTPERLGLNQTAAADSFIRVVFPRAELKAGVDVVAERTASANIGEKITSQTRCRIGAVDAVLWR